MSESLLSQAEYQKQLETIWNSKWGYENRSPIHDAADMVARYLDTDSIEQELLTIATTPKGEDMRVAIHDALQKLAIAKENPENAGVDVDTLYPKTDETYGICDASTASVDIENPLTGPDSWDVTFNSWDDLTSGLTFKLHAQSSGLAVLVLADIDDNHTTILTSGWTKLVEGVPASHISVPRKIVVYTKQFSSGDDVEVEMSKTGDAWLMGGLCLLYGVSSASSIQEDDVEWGNGTNTFTPTTKNNKKRLYLVDSLYTPSTSDPPFPSIVETMTGDDFMKKWSARNRIFAFYDDSAQGANTPTFSYYNPSDGSAVITSLTLDLEV